jgi:hypothetical protein
MRLTSLAASLLLTALNAHAAPSPAHAEIDALLGRLASSGCEFNRNGSWYPGADARAHLQRKLGYLEDKDAVPTTEKFIELGASTSSSSGKPYLVKCGNAAPVDSGTWLRTQLTAMRAVARPAKP